MKHFNVTLFKRGGVFVYKAPGSNRADIAGGNLADVLQAVAVEALAAGASDETTLAVTLDGVRTPKLDRRVDKALPWAALAVARVL